MSRRFIVLGLVASIFALLFVFGGACNTTPEIAAVQERVDVFQAPEGCVAPSQFLSTEYDTITVQQDGDGDHWVFLRANVASVTPQCGILVMRADMPILYSYLEGGVIKFFELDETFNFTESTLTDETYDVFTQIYLKYLDVEVRPRGGVKI